jgi:hypothetical protein
MSPGLAGIAADGVVYTDLIVASKPWWKNQRMLLVYQNNAGLIRYGLGLLALNGWILLL